MGSLSPPSGSSRVWSVVLDGRFHIDYHIREECDVMALVLSHI